MDTATPDRADATGDTPFVPWSLRATQAGATPADADAAIEKLVSLWSGGRLATAFDANELRRMRPYLQFVRVGAGQRVIRQDEAGDFMLCVLEGSLLVERVPTVGATAKLAEARAGDVLGDMAVLDGGPRFSTCTTRTPCLLAILETDALARLMKDDAHLGLVVLASMARRLSLRLRQVSARLSALLADT